MPSLSALSLHAASWAVAGLWQSLLLALLVALALRLVPGIPARVRFLLWTVTFTVLALLPLVHPAAGPAARPGAPAIFTLGLSWTVTIAALWIAISGFRLISMLREARRLRQIWRRAQPLAGEFAVRSIGTRRAQVCVSADVERPSVIGFIAPRVLIPEWLLSRLTPQELEQIVMHEMEHLRRRDDWSNLAQKLSLALFPLNPVLLWVEKQLCLEREMACDEGVLARTKSPHAYATCLTNLAAHSLYRRALSLSLGALELKSQLARRVYSILRRPAAMRPWQQAALSGTVVFALLGGAAGLARCPQLVAFSASQPPSAQSAAASQDIGEAFGTIGTPGAHMVALKAEMPAAFAPRPAMAKPAKLKSVGLKPATRLHHRAGLQHALPAQSGQSDWLVLTSDEVPVRRHLVVTVYQDPYSSNSFAAVPTDTGWLVFQL